MFFLVLLLKNSYRLVWATKLSLAAIGLVFPVLVSVHLNDLKAIGVVGVVGVVAVIGVYHKYSRID
jgi:hypothetical protein